MRSSDDVVVFDAYAWVEYALDTAKGTTVRTLLESASQALTPTTAISELKESMLRQGIRKTTIDRILTYIKGRTTVVDINSDIAEKAGEINFENKKMIKGWGMLDSFVYAVAKVKGGKVLTGDPHFKELRDVTYLGD